jgi:hypothetical protein
MKTLIIAALLWLLCPQVYAVTPDQDFANRCGASGVLVCQGFNSSTDLSSGYQNAGCGNAQEGFIDTNVKVSGAGSLRFTLRTISSCADIAGKFDLSLGGQFGNVANFPSNYPDLYIQYHMMVSASYVSNDLTYWHSSMKITDIYGHSSTCQADEFTVIYDPSAHYGIDWYNDCGNGYQTDPLTNVLLANCNSGTGLDCLYQQASSTGTGTNIGFNCDYHNGVRGQTGNGNYNCFVPAPDKWYTIYYHLHPGTPGGSDGTLDAWEMGPDGTILQWQKVRGNAGVSIWATGGQNGFVDRMYISPYMTEFGRGGAASQVQTYIWFDELIVSSQPIAWPAYVIPSSPTGGVAN